MIKAIILACVMSAGTGAPSYTLLLTDPASKWPCVSETERERLASLLVILAGQGRQEINQQFFEQCLSEVVQKNKPNLDDEQIRDVAAGCVYMSTLVFAESD